jgi:hypothetical protein
MSRAVGYILCTKSCTTCNACDSQEARAERNLTEPKCALFKKNDSLLVTKGPAENATDAPQP